MRGPHVERRQLRAENHLQSVTHSGGIRVRVDRRDGGVHMRARVHYVLCHETFVAAGREDDRAKAHRHAHGRTATARDADARHQRHHPGILFNPVQRPLLAGTDGLHGSRAQGVQTDGVEHQLQRRALRFHQQHARTLAVHVFAGIRLKIRHRQLSHQRVRCLRNAV